MRCTHATNVEGQLVDQWVKAFPNNLSEMNLIPRTQGGRRKMIPGNCLLTVAGAPWIVCFYIHTYACACT